MATDKTIECMGCLTNTMQIKGIGSSRLSIERMRITSAPPPFDAAWNVAVQSQSILWCIVSDAKVCMYFILGMETVHVLSRCPFSH